MTKLKTKRTLKDLKQKQQPAEPINNDDVGDDWDNPAKKDEDLMEYFKRLAEIY